MKRKLCMALSALMMVSGMAGFGIVAGASDGDVTLRYGIWDDNQKAALREIADKFEEENPGIKVEIEVTPWKVTGPRLRPLLPAEVHRMCSG